MEIYNNEMKIGIYLIAIMLLISFVSAVSPHTTTTAGQITISPMHPELVKQNTDITINIHCMNETAQKTGTTTQCKLDLYNQVGTETLSIFMTNKSNDYVLTISGGNLTSDGEYVFFIKCNSTNEMGTLTDGFTVTTNELTSTDTAGQIRFGVMLLIGLIIAIVIYKWVSKFFGSMIVFAIGMGIMRSDAQNGWIGLIVLASGFIMILYSLIDTGKKRRKY